MAINNKVFDVAKPGTTSPDTGSKPMVVGHKSLAQDPTLKKAGKESSKKPPRSEKKRIQPITKFSDTEQETKDKEDESIDQNVNENKHVTIQSKVTEKTVNSQADNSHSSDIENMETKIDAEESSDTTENSQIKEADDSSDSNNDKSNNNPNNQAEKSPEEQESDAVDLQLEREQKLQSLIKSKKYNVNIKHSSGSSVKTFLITFALFLTIGVVIVAGLIDAEVIDTSIELPFDLL